MRVLVAVLLVGIVPVQLAAAPKVSSDDSTGVSNAASAVAALKKLGARIKQDDQDNVVELNLSRSKITDAGLLHLKGLTSLQTLSLYRTQVTDAGLVHLTGLTSLKSLDLRGTKVTDAGVADLQKVVPNCKITK